jgi:transposase
MSDKGFSVITENVAGIDIGTEKYHVSVDGQTVKVFGTNTPSTIELISYLKTSGIKDVSMEATGVLWVPLFDMLESQDIKAHLLNGAHAKNIPAQKSDYKDCRWLRKVLMYGLVRDSFVPEANIRELRVYVRERDGSIESAAESIQHMQKAFELMNVKLHNVLSDTMGVSGTRIIEAVIKGEKNAHRLSRLAHSSITDKKLPELEAALTGNYKEEYVFLLEQAYEKYNFIQKQIRKCDKKIEKLLKKMSKNMPEPPKTASKPVRHNQPQIENLHDDLMRILNGRQATVLPGIADKTVMKLISELGTDFSIWPSDKHFVSYIGLSPRKYQSGKMNRTHRMPVKSNAGQIFRECALSISASKHIALKGFYNRIKSRSGTKTALKATARKLAVLFYRLMTKGMEYVEMGLKQYEEKYKERVLKNIEKKAREFGYVLQVQN